MSGQFKPHLACDAELNKVQFPVGVMLKYDGARLLVRDGIAVGRSLKQYKNKIMTSTLSHPLLNGFDMEVIGTYENDPDLCRHTTSLVNTIEGGLPPIVKVFDYVTEETKSYTYTERLYLLGIHLSVHGEFFEKFPIKVEMPTLMVAKTIQEVQNIYEKALEAKYEGIILRKLEGKHKDGRCTTKEGSYLRMKPTGDAEGIVVRIEEAYENQNEAKTNELGHTERSTHQENMVPKGMVGALWLKLPDSTEVKVGAGKLNHEERKFYWENPDQILGKIVKYAFLDTGQKDKPRHPRFISFRVVEDMSE